MRFVEDPRRCRTQTLPRVADGLYQRVVGWSRSPRIERGLTVPEKRAAILELADLHEFSTILNFLPVRFSPICRGLAWCLVTLCAGFSNKSFKAENLARRIFSVIFDKPCNTICEPFCEVLFSECCDKVAATAIVTSANG